MAGFLTLVSILNPIIIPNKSGLGLCWIYYVPKDKGAYGRSQASNTEIADAGLTNCKSFEKFSPDPLYGHR